MIKLIITIVTLALCGALIFVSIQVLPVILWSLLAAIIMATGATFIEVVWTPNGYENNKSRSSKDDW